MYIEEDFVKNGMTRKMAQAVGIDYPLQKGWVKRLMLKDLTIAQISAFKKAFVIMHKSRKTNKQAIDNVTSYESQKPEHRPSKVTNIDPFSVDPYVMKRTKLRHDDNNADVINRLRKEHEVRDRKVLEEEKKDPNSTHIRCSLDVQEEFAEEWDRVRLKEDNELIRLFLHGYNRKVSKNDIELMIEVNDVQFISNSNKEGI